MDIDKWLDDIVAAEGHGPEPFTLGIPSFLVNHRVETYPNPKKEQDRKQAYDFVGSDSSILEVAPTKPTRIAEADGSGPESAQSTAKVLRGTHSTFSTCKTPIGTYQRRPRRKMKTNLRERDVSGKSKSKDYRGEQGGKRRDCGSRKKQRRRKGASSAAIIDAFHPNNILAERLTVGLC